MKTFRTISMMLALTVIANIALATGNLRVNILPLNAERAVVAISNDGETKFQISIEDAYGSVVYFKETEGNVADYRKVYDFSKLENGNYKLIVSLDGVKGQREFAINNGSINVGKEKMLATPFFSYKEDILRVAFLNHAGEKTNLYIYNDGELVYSKALENSFSVNEGLNLSKLASGEYQVVLASGNEVYDYAVAVK
ncbi:T9SS type A sorting domain-containing protein [Sunxiuqinia dokdonensis]|uniref:Secretion system C-terminal sorting domain-containing protein n=1 Tax=Sunxiuqinia dokdonensis TaxID=1409788 RepID=A0A0L8VFX9_9BACT|nr:hypothetical protein [Sunxiuqinia dokdonensis]KOH47082.1 hypothetical protein NC99_01250 [Sunxiuqinia dokdonensis]